MRKYKYAIEMGGGFTNIYVKGQGLALKEPTLVAAEPTEEGYKVIALGLMPNAWLAKPRKTLKFSHLVFMASTAIMNTAWCF